MFDKELEFAISLALVAGKKIMSFYKQDCPVSLKKDLNNSPVTEADIASNYIISNEIKKCFPDHGIISEEQSSYQKNAEKVWVVDPLDGTKEFIAENGEFAVQIGLLYKRQPVLGVVFLPAKNKLFYAQKNKGCFLFNKEKSISLSCRKKVNLKNMTMAVSRSHIREKEKEILKKFPDCKKVKHGSVGGKVSLIINGAADFFFYCGSGTHEWDVCAPQMLMEEAGGVVSDMSGARIVYGKDKTNNENGILISAGSIHKELLNIIINKS